MEDTSVDITTINVGEGAKGGKLIDLEVEETHYMKSKGSGDCAYPLMIFCHKCSSTQEYNIKAGGWREKWLVEPQDLVFTVGYDTDEDGELYAKCFKCNFDLRNDYNPEDANNNKQNEASIHHISIAGVKYEDSSFVIPLETYKKSIREGISWKPDILTSISGQTYRITWSNYSNTENLVSKSGKIYINRKHWKNRHLYQGKSS